MIKQTTLFLHLCFLIVAFQAVYAQEKNDCNPKEEQFMFVFSDPNSLKDAGGIEKIDMISRLYVQGNPNSPIEVNAKKYEIPYTGYLLIEEAFPYVPYEYSSEEVIKIKANSSVSVVVERVNKFSTHRFPLLPVSQWGKQYSIPGYQDQSKLYKVNSFIDIISKDKKTNVSIKDAQGNVIKKLTLDAGQNYEYNNTDDLTGYSVESNKDIGVISGNHCLRISSACDHTALMLSDNSQLGKKYYNPGTSFFSAQTIHRIVAVKNSTQIKIDGVSITTLNKGGFYEYQREKPHVIEASSPVLVYSIFNKGSQSSPEYSVDPSVFLIPSVDHAIHSVQFSFPEYMIYSKDVQIVMKTDQTRSLLVDGSFPDIRWTPFSYDTSVSCGTLHFSDEGKHSLSAANPWAYFIPLLMGRGWDVSVGTSLKIGTTNLLTGENPPCPIVSQKSISLPPPEPVMPQEIILTDIHKPIIVKKELVEVFVFDNAEEDGDIISIYLNNKLIYPDVRVLKAGIWLKLELEKGENVISIKAENEGDIYPNTAGLTFDDGITRQTIILHNKKGQSKSLKIIGP